ncbi:MAG: hypothetical protein H6559_03595 [Lewinellaceae bacterium]|nr:hypothetical protein [Lewinellaceae bacterium]
MFKHPPPQPGQTVVEQQVSKRRKARLKISPSSNERRLRQQLAQRVSGTHLGLMLLLPFHLKLGAWPMLQQYLGTGDSLACRMALQMVHEAAICTNRIRAKNTLCNQGFALANGLSFLPTDKQIHELSYGQNIEQSQALQLAL